MATCQKLVNITNASLQAVEWAQTLKTLSLNTVFFLTLNIGIEITESNRLCQEVFSAFAFFSFRLPIYPRPARKRIFFA
jgi:hypothetical protein